MKIDKLTPDQTAAFSAVRDEWIAHGLSTEPADRVRAEKGVAEAYRSVGLEPPENFVWLDSPAAGFLFVAVLTTLCKKANIKKKVRNQVESQVWTRVWDQVGNQVRDQVRDQVWDQVGDQVWDQVGDQVWNQVGNQIKDQIRNEVWNQVGDQVWYQVGDQVWNQVDDQVRDQVGSQVRDQVRDQVWTRVRDQVGDQVWDLVGNQVGDQVWDLVGNQIKDQVRNQVESQVWSQVENQVESQVWSQVWSQVESQVESQVGNQVGNQVGDQVRNQVGDQVWTRVWDQVGDQVGDQVWGQVRDQVWTRVGDQVGNQVRDQVRDQVASQVWDQVGDQVWYQVWSQVWSQVGNQVASQALNQVCDQVWNQIIWGCQDAGWLSFYDFFATQTSVEGVEVLRGLSEVAKSAGWWWALKDFAVLTERPNILNFDAQGRLHNEHGPAVSYPDGCVVWSWHGVRVPQSLIEDEWDATKILDEENSEIRRCAIERVGWDRFIEDSDMHLVATAPDPGNYPHELELYELPPALQDLYDNRARILLCTNGTPEADGSRHRFGLPVPAHHSDPVAAAADLYGWPVTAYRNLQTRR